MTASDAVTARVTVEHLIVLPEQLGPVLRSLRRARNMTQAQLAARLGMTRQAVTELERKPERATYERLHRVFAALDVEVVLRDRTTVEPSPW